MFKFNLISTQEKLKDNSVKLKDNSVKIQL